MILSKYRRLPFLLSLFAVILVLSCGARMTKGQAFPRMYGSEAPMSILVLPPINQSTAAEAEEYYTTTIAEPLSATGYYVYPLEVVLDLLKAEGLYESGSIESVPPERFKEYFGADAVLIIKIIKWDKVYYVVGGNVTVSVAFELKSTQTGAVLWKYRGTIKLDTSGKSGNNYGLAGLVANVIETAVKTASADYVPLAKKANISALKSMPYGKYHERNGLDRDSAVVQEALLDSLSQ